VQSGASLTFASESPEFDRDSGPNDDLLQSRGRDHVLHLSSAAKDEMVSRNLVAFDHFPLSAPPACRFVHANVQKGGRFGDALRQLSGAGPISKQSWLAQERYRSAPTTEIVEASLLSCPPGEAPVRAAMSGSASVSAGAHR